MKTKKCKDCGEIKPVSEFYRRSKVYLHSYCKECYNIRSKAYRALPKAIAVRVKYQAKYRALPEVKAARARYNARWEASIRGKASHAVSLGKRRALVVTQKQITVDEWLAILKEYSYRCAYCGTDIDIGIEHIIPLSKGGEHIASNIVPACQSCNSSKRNKTGDDLPERFKEVVHMLSIHNKQLTMCR